jgi:hypothetical protein
VRGALLRFHLAFVPRDAHVTVFRGLGYKHYRLRPGRTLSWKASREGVVSLDVHAAGGSAGYIMRVALRT